ncbi:MAG: PAS domain S-box protein [Gemmatimonadota bacterium]
MSKRLPTAALGAGLAWFACASDTEAQVAGAPNGLGSIASVVRDADGGLAPDWLGDAVEVVGTVSIGPVSILPALVPYPEIIAGALLLMLAGLALHFARQRRAAERVAGEQFALANRLRASDAALRAAEQRMRHLLVTSPSIIYAVSVDGDRARTSWIGDNVSWILGYSREQAMEPAWFADCLHPDDRDVVLHSIGALAFGNCSQEHISQEYRFRHADGAYRWFRNDLRVVERKGSRSELVGASVDVTEQREVTIALAAAEAHYRRLVATSPYGIFAVDARGLFTEVNPVAAEVFGRRVEDLLGQSVFEILPSESLEVVQSEFKRQRFDPAYRSDFEMLLVRANGERRLVHVRSAPVLHRDTVVGAHGVLRDITEERSRAQRIQMLGAALENLNHGVAISDSSQRIIFANSDFRKLFGVDADADDLPSLEDLLPDAAAREQRTAIREVLAVRGRWAGRVWRCRVDDGRVFPLDAVQDLVPDPDGEEPLTVTICSDATDTIVQEQQLRRAERLSSLGTLVGGVAHELNNPLNAVINYAELLLRQARSPGEREDLETVVREGRRAAGIVANLRAIARQAQSADAVKEPVDLNELVSRVLEARGADLAAANIVTEFTPGGDLPRPWMDAAQLEQALSNLVTNAQQAMSEHRGEGVLHIRTRAAGAGVRIVVQDDGPGIASDNLDRVFDPFWTTKDPGKGTGLGLSLVHNVVAEHEGRITVRSKEGFGSTFQIDIPVMTMNTRAPVDAPPLSEATATPQKPEGLRVLVVDDEPAVRSLLMRYLRRVGHSPEEAREGNEALRMLEAARYDVILTDLRMPGMGGEELIARLRADGRGLDRRVVVMSGDPTALEGSAELAGLPSLLKPVALTDVAQAIEQRVATLL